jgi:hypothetical protein
VILYTEGPWNVKVTHLLLCCCGECVCVAFVFFLTFTIVLIECISRQIKVTDFSMFLRVCFSVINKFIWACGWVQVRLLRLTTRSSLQICEIIGQIYCA